ncbi:MAG: hypothetical protein ACYTHK_05035 [Planctomycetota bacterium]
MLTALLLLLASPDPRALEAETKAREALTGGNKLEALAQYETAMRHVESMPEKARLRDLYRAIGWVTPPPVGPREQITLGGHIMAEKIRVWDKAADRLAGQGKRRAAIILRRAIIGLLGGKGQRAKQEQDKIKRIIRNLTEKPSEEEKEAVAKILRSRKLGKNVLKAARKLLEQREYRTVVRLCQEVMVGSYDQESRTAAIELRKEAEAKAAKDMTPGEKQAARDVLDDVRFKRLATSVSRHFIYLGPKKFVESLKKDDRRELDLAYIYQSDLANTLRTHDGTRIVIYYQETFDFGGGLAAAGGKLIRIGRPAIRAPIAGALHFHELGHNIFGRGWLHRGFTEGIAEFAVAFTYDSLGQTKRAQNFVVGCRDQFVRYFLGRDMRYDYIQPYKPSAGFLFSFLPPGEAPYDWTPYRRMYHRMREQQFGSWPERQHQIMRYFGYLMALEYGMGAYDRLARWGWPVSRDDHARVPAEAAELLSAAKQGESALRRGMAVQAEGFFRAVLDATSDGHLANRARYGMLQLAVQAGASEKVDALKRRLGILDDYLVLGPFHARKQTAWVPMPPEREIDLSNPKVTFRYGTAKWKRAKVEPTGAINLRKQGYGYPEHACAFALCYLRVERATPARFWIASDDGHALYVNGEIIQREPNSHAFRFDDRYGDTVLRSGWNRVLVKVHNTNGNWGFLLRVTRPDGTPITGLERSVDDHEPGRDAVPTRKPRELVDDGFKSFSSARWKVTAGKFDSRNGLLTPQGDKSVGQWQRFDIDPDKPRRGPSNLMWLVSDDLPRCDDFEAKITVNRNAKWGVTFDGENERDGQSGHTLVFDAAEGGKQVQATWYRYDKQLFRQLGTKVEKADAYLFRIRRIGRKWWVSVNEQPLFEAIDAPRLPAHGFGVMTWGRNPAFDRIRFARLKPPGSGGR